MAEIANCSSGEIDRMAIIKASQNKERKELQAKITAMKHSVQKNDKKKKKEIAQQIENLEKELKERHEEELEKLMGSIEKMAIINEIENKTNSQIAIKKSQIREEIGNADNNKNETSSFRFKEIQLTKAQQKKEEKRKKHALSRSTAAAQDAENAQSSQGTKERSNLQRLLAQQGLRIHDVQPDGDCLFSALAHQCDHWQLGNYSMAKLRQLAADYIKHHKDDFLPFLTDPEGKPLGEDEFIDYCDKIGRNCSEGGNWGGEPELRAISTGLERQIEVLRANGQKTTFGEQFNINGDDSLLITYHDYAYTLGEHYNSTEPAETNMEEEEENFNF